MQRKVIISYEKKTFVIEYTGDPEMSIIFDEFAKNKIKSDKINFEFFYDRNKIEPDIRLSKLNTFNKNEILIFAEKRGTINKCPSCICNDCIIRIENYKLHFYGCKYNHNNLKLFEDYNNSQKIDYSQITCNNTKCGKSQNEIDGDFYKCLYCSQLTDRSKYYCYLCNLEHIKDNNNHITVKYDEKNYYCGKHFKGKSNINNNKFTKYCETCNQDLCEECKEHSNHKYIYYNSEYLKIEETKKTLKNMKEKINDIKQIAEDIKHRLDGAVNLFSKYYEIANDIISKYELYNQNLKNYRIIKSIKNLDDSNPKIMKDLDKIINEYDIQKRIFYLIDIYHFDRNSYSNAVINTNYDDKTPNDLNNSENNINYFANQTNISKSNYKQNYKKNKSIKKLLKNVNK